MPPNLCTPTVISHRFVRTETFVSHRLFFSLSLAVSSSRADKLSLSTRSDFLCEPICSPQAPDQAATDDDDDTQESSLNDLSEGEESADNGEIDLAHEFELSQRERENLWTTHDRDVFILQEDDVLSAIVTTTSDSSQRIQPTSIMKMSTNKSIDSIIEQQQQTQPLTTTTSSLRPKVRFNLDPQYEREREWNKVNKLLGNSVEWTDEFEV